MLNNAVGNADSFVGFSKQTFNNQELKKTYIEDKNFDPNGFFFITYRSHAIGLAMCHQNSQGEWVIPFLTSEPKHYGKGVEECLINLVLRYLKEKSAGNIFVEVHPELLPSFEAQVKPILVKYGFQF